MSGRYRTTRIRIPRLMCARNFVDEDHLAVELVFHAAFADYGPTHRKSCGARI